VVHGIRWHIARRWERMLDDPATAATVPPLESHLESVHPSPTGFRAISWLLLVVAGLVAFLAYGALAASGSVPFPHDNDTRQGLGAAALFLVLAAVSAVRRVRRWWVARTVIRLASDVTIGSPQDATEQARPRRSSSIPRLHVAFGGEWIPRPPGDFSLTGGGSTSDPLDILYLRLFDNSIGTERFVSAPFRRYSYVYLLRSAEQVDADELESAEASGRPTSMFITTAADLDAALDRAPRGPHELPRPEGFRDAWHFLRDHEQGMYPVRALLCHDSFWKAAVDILFTRMDYVALDLSGYRPEHFGTRYELQRVIDRVPIDQIALLAEATSDQKFLTAQVEAAWSQMTDGSPNTGTGERTVRISVWSTQAMEMRGS